MLLETLFFGIYPRLIGKIRKKDDNNSKKLINSFIAFHFMLNILPFCHQ